jgi:hypothetical protein
VTSHDSFEHLKDRFAAGGLGASARVDLVLCCVDNYAARMAVNQACTELDQPWMESGASEDGVSGHVQLMLPGRTACFACVPPLALAEGSEQSIKREGVCAASLPTTIGIVAGLLVQNALKELLDFGEVSYCLGYHAMTNYFPASLVHPNPECSLPACVEAQARYMGQWTPAFARAPARDEAPPVVHGDNPWGLEALGKGVMGDELYQQDSQQQGQGQGQEQQAYDQYAPAGYEGYEGYEGGYEGHAGYGAAGAGAEGSAPQQPHLEQYAAHEQGHEQGSENGQGQAAGVAAAAAYPEDAPESAREQSERSDDGSDDELSGSNVGLQQSSVGVVGADDSSDDGMVQTRPGQSLEGLRGELDRAQRGPWQDDEDESEVTDDDNGLR